MATASFPLGKFTCPVAFQVVRPPAYVRHEEDGVTYLTGRDYELAYQTTLRFENGDELAITAKLFGEVNRLVVVRDASGKPVRVSGYTQGRSEISDRSGNVIFEGRYYDSRIHQALTGDDALTPTGARIVDHWENGFGRGPYAGHAFSLGAPLRREGDPPPSGQATGYID